MVKSSLKKNRTKTVTTNLVISWGDTITTTVINRPQTGNPIYVVPRKGEASFKRMLWNVSLNQNPTVSISVKYAIMNHQANTVLAINDAGFTAKALMILRQNWENLTSVGVVDVTKSKEVDMDTLVLSRPSNLQSDDEYEISPAYQSDTAAGFNQDGTLWLTETLTQEFFRDDTDEWIGYTFEESAS